MLCPYFKQQNNYIYIQYFFLNKKYPTLIKKKKESKIHNSHARTCKEVTTT